MIQCYAMSTHDRQTFLGPGRAGTAKMTHGPFRQRHDMGSYAREFAERWDLHYKSEASGMRSGVVLEKVRPRPLASSLRKFATAKPRKSAKVAPLFPCRSESWRVIEML